MTREQRVYVLEHLHEYDGQQSPLRVFSSHQKACSATPQPHKAEWADHAGTVFYWMPEDAQGEYYKITKVKVQ